MAEDPRKGPGEGGKGGTALLERPEVRQPRRYKVLLHNDDYTTQEWVVMVLEEYFHQSRPDAVRLMLQVHHTGSAVVGIYPRDVAETKVEQVNESSRQAGYPLLCTCEPE